MLQGEEAEARSLIGVAIERAAETGKAAMRRKAACFSSAPVPAIPSF